MVLNYLRKCDERWTFSTSVRVLLNKVNIEWFWSLWSWRQTSCNSVKSMIVGKSISANTDPFPAKGYTMSPEPQSHYFQVWPAWPWVLTMSLEPRVKNNILQAGCRIDAKRQFTGNSAVKNMEDITNCAIRTWEICLKSVLPHYRFWFG